MTGYIASGAHYKNIGRITKGGDEMGMIGRVATWLELAAAPQHHSRKGTVRVHPVGGEDGSCFAVSVDGRWVCTGSGEVTVFKGIDAVLHFFEVLHVEAFEPGCGTDENLLCDAAHYCVQCDRRQGLQPCRGCRISQAQAEAEAQRLAH